MALPEAGRVSRRCLSAAVRRGAPRGASSPGPSPRAGPARPDADTCRAPRAACLALPGCGAPRPRGAKLVRGLCARGRTVNAMFGCLPCGTCRLWSDGRSRSRPGDSRRGGAGPGRALMFVEWKLHLDIQRTARVPRPRRPASLREIWARCPVHTAVFSNAFPAQAWTLTDGEVSSCQGSSKARSPW